MKLPALFNPSNDMALAANLRQYTPPRHIQQMESDLADLARFWDEGPWGWSLATKERYRRMGIVDDDLPSDEWLAELRRLSSREFGVGYYRRIAPLLSPNEGGGNPLLPCQARFYSTHQELKFLPIMEEVRRGLILKAPWSSSGRGNIVVKGEPNETTLQRVQRIIREQGGIVVEPFYDKALDFAMEFWVDSDVQFMGYSVFSADEMGRYHGNWVESQEQLLQRISLPNELLDSLIAYHRQALSALPYRGPVGIDMMRLTDGRVHPCVEINFRMTMGYLTLLLYNKGIRDDQLLAGRTDGFTAQIQQGRLCLTTPMG